jgi:hypothetical protein
MKSGMAESFQDIIMGPLLVAFMLVLGESDRNLERVEFAMMSAIQYKSDQKTNISMEG